MNEGNYDDKKNRRTLGLQWTSFQDWLAEDGEKHRSNTFLTKRD